MNMEHIEKSLFTSSSEDSDSGSSEKQSNKNQFTEKCEISKDKFRKKMPEEDLFNLIQKIRKMLILPLPEHCVINIDTHLRIFLTDSDVKSLFIFQENNSLKAKFIAPQNNNGIMMYFVKRDGTINIDLDNFLDTVLFGNIDKYFLKTLLYTTKYIFTSTVYRKKSLPYRIISQVTKNLELLLCYITEIFYKNFGLTVLYIPVITLHLKKESNIETDDILRLFENIIVRWCNQLSDLVYDNELDYYEMNEFSPLILIQYWQYKLDNLELVHKVLEDRHAKFLCHILKEHHSDHIKLLGELHKKLTGKMNETKENVKFLENLRQVSEKIDSSHAENFAALIPELILRIDVILSESSYFKSVENAAVLIDSMTQLVINICKRKVNIEIIRKGETEDQMKLIISSALICTVYKEILKQLNNFSITAFTRLLSELKSNGVPDSIDLFIQRNIDLLGLCSLINIFLNNKEQIKQRTKFEYYINMANDLELISAEFFNNLQEFHSVKEIIFNFHCLDWYNLNYRFQDQIEDIKRKICDLVDKAFSFVTTVEDGLDILRIVYQYYKWIPVKNFLRDKIIKVMKIFKDEANEIRHFLVNEKMIISSKNVDRVREVLLIFLKKRRLQFLFELFGGNMWLKKEKELDKNEYEKYFEDIIFEIDQFIITEYKEWNHKLPTNFASRLKQPLIGKCFHKSGLIEVNIDRRVLKILKEAYLWVMIGFIPTTNIGKLLNIANHILILYGNLEELVMTYNRILIILSSDEQILYSPFIRICADTINPALCTLHWDHEQSNKIILDYLKQIKCIEKTVQIYKIRNKEIIGTFKMLCQLNLLHLHKNQKEDLLQEFKKIRFLAFKKVIIYYNRIVSCLQAIFDSFGYHILETKDGWNSYIEKIDSLLEIALKFCLKNTLNIILKTVSPNFESDSVDMEIKVFAKIDNHEIVFQPTFFEIIAFFKTLKTNLLELIKLIPRLFNNFKLSKVVKKSEYSEQLFLDEDIDNVQTHIDSAIQGNLKEVRSHLEYWHQYASLWVIDIEQYIEKYEEMSFSYYNTYETSFIMYNHIINEMRRVNTVENIGLFVLDTENLASEVVKRCQIRLQTLSQKLKQNLLERMQQMFRLINAEYIKLQMCDYKSEVTLEFIKDLVVNSEKKETEILKFKKYVNLLEKYKFDVPFNIKKQQENMEKIWLRFSNLMERYRLRLESCMK